MKERKKKEQVKLPWHSHAVSAWPLIMVILGGGLGGLCGGLSYGLSMYTIQKRGVSPSSYIIATLIGVGSIVLYILAVIGLSVAFPQLFSQ